jgi:hypothetical protein
MRLITLQALTWGTITAAVSSALWLAASEPGWPDARSRPPHNAATPRAPVEPKAATNAEMRHLLSAERTERVQVLSR